MAEVLAGAARWTVVEADCRDVLATLPDGCVDAVVTDPPYEAEAHQLSRRSHRGTPGDRGGFSYFPIDFAAMDEETRGTCGAHFARLVRRWALIFCQLEGVRPWREACSLRHMRTCIWVKPDGAPQFTGDRPGTGYECIEVMHATTRSRWNGGGRRGVFVYNNCGSQTRKPDEDHQTPKPLPLMLELVSLFTDHGECILDPFAGSGTSGVAALRLGRRVILIEREPKWAALSRDRLRAEEQNTTLQAMRAGQVPMFGGEP
jgi:site-specific DNA-methyltransferase (adenine-specific)